MVGMPTIAAMNAAVDALAALRAATFPQLAAPPATLRRELATTLSLRKLARGRLLFAQGGRCPALFAVLSGEIAIRLHAADGSSSLLEHVRPTRLFGLSAFATGLPSRYEAAASETTQLLLIGPAALCAADGPLARLCPRAAAGAGAALRRHPAPAGVGAPPPPPPSGCSWRWRSCAANAASGEAAATAAGDWRATQADPAELAGVSRQTANEWLQASGVRLGYRLMRG